jgi:hypothetical protein
VFGNAKAARTIAWQCDEAMKYRFAVLITPEDRCFVARCAGLRLPSQGSDRESARANW